MRTEAPQLPLGSQEALARDSPVLPAYIVLPMAGAGIATVVEMVSKDGYDTVLCPAAAMMVMIPLMALFGGFV